MRRPIIFTSIFPPSIFKQFPSNRFRNIRIVPQQHFSSHGLMIYRLEPVTMKSCNVQDEFPPLSCSLWCASKSSFRPASSARPFFTLWLTIRRTLPSAVAEYAAFVICHHEKKKKKPVLCEKSCDGGPLVVAQRKIFSPFKPPSTIATVNIRKHPVSMHGAELFYPDDYNALLFYSTPEMNCARCTQ